jgi:hypothetical protein
MSSRITLTTLSLIISLKQVSQRHPIRSREQQAIIINVGLYYN